MRQTVLYIGIIILIALTVIAAGCGSAGNSGGTTNTASPGKTMISGIAGTNLTASISNPDGIMHKGKHDFTLTFYQPSGKTADVGTVALNFRMAAMASMPEMNAGATFTTTGTPGAYRGTADLTMLGDWEAQITFDGPAGKGSFTLPIVVKP